MLSQLAGQLGGADKLGEQYAIDRSFKTNIYPADWNGQGKKAGPIRNKKMAENADALIAFWDGKSSGTKHMIDTARIMGLKVRVINY